MAVNEGVRNKDTGAYSSDKEGFVAKLCKDNHDERRSEAIAEAQRFFLAFLGTGSRRILIDSAYICTGKRRKHKTRPKAL